MSRLFAGPWVGEFGWELFNWQAWIRHKSRRFDETYIACKKGHEALYKDFATHIELYDITLQNTDCGNCIGFVYDNRHTKLGLKFDEVILPWTNPRFKPIADKNEPQEFIRFRRPSTHPKLDILFHGRYTDKYATGYRNWPLSKWTQLAEKLLVNYRVGSIGTKSAAIYIPETVDLRGINLDTLIGIMCNSRIIAGPSSGPLHLAALCNLPQVVWASHESTTNRYFECWNPFNTDVISILPSVHTDWDNSVGWNPDINTVYDSCIKLLNKPAKVF